jgi:hypothetical protein
MAAALQPVPKPLNREDVIDRYGELETRISQFAPTVAEHKLLKAQIEGWFTSCPADQPQIAKGKRYTIQLTAREWTRTIANPQTAFAELRKAAGSLEKAIAAITIPLGKAIDKWIPEAKHKLFLKREQNGPRTLKTIRNDA